MALDRAYINAPNAPTPIAEGLEVHHYSRPRRIEPVRNALIELQEESPIPRHHLSREREPARRHDAARDGAARDGAARAGGSEVIT